MGSALKNPRGADLYAYWGPVIAKALDKAVDRRALKSPFLMVNFKEVKDGKARALMLFVKQARGMMARWAIENRITRAEDLKKFNVGGYKFSKPLSSADEWVFTRPQPKPKKG
jgi:hypothetical protein